MIEATIVLPILILTILSLIMLIVYFYACLNTQVQVHDSLVNEIRQETVLLSVSRKEKSTSSTIGGAVSLLMHKDYKATYYQINEPRLIRLGKMIGDD